MKQIEGRNSWFYCRKLGKKMHILSYQSNIDHDHKTKKVGTLSADDYRKSFCIYTFLSPGSITLFKCRIDFRSFLYMTVDSVWQWFIFHLFHFFFNVVQSTWKQRNKKKLKQFLSTGSLPKCFILQVPGQGWTRPVLAGAAISERLHSWVSNAGILMWDPCISNSVSTSRPHACSDI